MAHGAAIAAVVVVEMPQWVTFSAIAALFANLVVEIRHALLRMPDSVIAVEINSDNVLAVQLRRGGWRECDVLGSTYVASFLVILNLRETLSRNARRIMVLPDSMSADDFRQLRVWLRWKAGQPAG